MEDWTGFTDEELRKLKKTPSRLDYNYDQGNVRRPVAPRNMTESGRPTGRAGIRPSGPIQGRPPRKETPGTLSTDMMLSQPKPQPAAARAPKEQSPTNSQSPKALEPVKETSQESEKRATKESSEEKSEAVEEVEVKEVSEKAYLQKQLSKIEGYQLQQKVMEEQNKQKKKFLFEAIAQKQRKAKAEASKLQHIQKELATLDQMLSVDVAIIRNHIEEASREFLEAQKRYEAAEKEFVESKLALHHANEQKESLTEHLYTIIHQNEVRKAKKLTELMEKLELAEDLEVPDVQVELTNLMPNILPEMSTISSFDYLNRKRTTSEDATTPKSDKKEETVNGENTVANDNGGINVNSTETAQTNDAKPVETSPVVVQPQVATNLSGTEASGQVTSNANESPSKEAKSSSLDSNSDTTAHKDQNDNVKTSEGLT